MDGHLFDQPPLQFDVADAVHEGEFDKPVKPPSRTSRCKTTQNPAWGNALKRLLDVS